MERAPLGTQPIRLWWPRTLWASWEAVGDTGKMAFWEGGRLGAQGTPLSTSAFLQRQPEATAKVDCVCVIALAPSRDVPSGLPTEWLSTGWHGEACSVYVLHTDMPVF